MRYCEKCGTPLNLTPEGEDYVIFDFPEEGDAMFLCEICYHEHLCDCHSETGGCLESVFAAHLREKRDQSPRVVGDSEGVFNYENGQLQER